MVQIPKANSFSSPLEQSITDNADVPSSSVKSRGAFLTIREVADLMNVQQHVLRFWETKFSQVKPLKRGGGRRYYRPDDVILLKNIQYLLHDQGYTIKGVQKLLKAEGKKAFTKDLFSQSSSAPVEAALSQDIVENTSEKITVKNDNHSLRDLLDELKALREYIAAQ